MVTVILGLIALILAGAGIIVLIDKMCDGDYLGAIPPIITILISLLFAYLTTESYYKDREREIAFKSNILNNYQKLGPEGNK